MVAIGNDDELQRTRRAPSQAGPFGGTAGAASQLNRQLTLWRPCNRRHLSHPYGGGLSLENRPDQNY
jgi:hypothetical protein